MNVVVAEMRMKQDDTERMNMDVNEMKTEKE